MMITKNIKYPYTKLILDVVGIVSSIAFLMLIVINFYADFKSNGSSEIGIKWDENDLVLGAILIAIILMCAIASFILKLMKKEG